MSLIDDLNDHCFVLATDYLVSLCEEVEQEGGRKPTLEELCQLLTWGLRSCSADILEDVDPRFVVELKPKVKKHRKVKLTPGDIVAIPSGSGAYFLVVFIVKNTHGAAYGIFKGRYHLKPLPMEWRPQTLPYPVYSDSMPVTEGRWQVIDHRPELLDFFPEPEYYLRHSPDAGVHDPYGGASNTSGSYRKLTKEEADAYARFRFSTRVWGSLSCEIFEDFLERHLGNTNDNDKES